MVAYVTANPAKVGGADPRAFQCKGLMAAGVQCQLTAGGGPTIWRKTPPGCQRTANTRLRSGKASGMKQRLKVKSYG